MALDFWSYVVLVVLYVTLVIARDHRKGNGWEYFCVGNCDKDVETPTQTGTVLVTNLCDSVRNFLQYQMGGSTDVDEAFRWMIHLSGGGDFLVIRASGTDAYNDYIYSMGNSSKSNSQ